MPNYSWTSCAHIATSSAPGDPIRWRPGRCVSSASSAASWSITAWPWTNRLTSVLKQYFPQALDWVGTLASRQGGDFLRTWPTLTAVQRARAATVRRFYQQHNCRRAAVIAARLEQIATAVPLTTGAVRLHLHVGRFQVAVDDTGLVCGLQRLGNLLRNRQRLIQRDPVPSRSGRRRKSRARTRSGWDLQPAPGRVPACPRTPRCRGSGRCWDG